MSAALALLLLAAPRASAHEYPIRPVLATLRVEPDRLVVDLDADSVYWIEEVVGLHPMPPRDWPESARRSAENYVNAHLRLTADGAPLRGRLVAASYVQRPWQVNEQGRVRLRLVYPPVAGGAVLAGTADFYEEYRRERLDEKLPIPPAMAFETDLAVPGARRFALKPGDAFSLPASEARRGFLARALDSARAGAAAALGTAEGWAALAALALSLGPGAPSARRAALLAAALLAGALVPAPAPAALGWAAGLAAAAAAGRWTPENAAPALEALALAGLARAWTASAAPWLPRAVPGALELGGAALGALAAAAALLAAGVAGVTVFRRSLDADSQAHAPELFARRRRLAATALGIVAMAGLLGGAR